VEVLAPSPWELLYRGLAPAQQADLLALATQQGLLYSHQLPPAPSPRNLPPADEPRTWNLLGKILAGHVGELDPIRPAAIAVVDEALDEAQRGAVAAALATPDVCLIQGPPGTGKSRVLAEIVTQAGRRGDRVLLLAAHPAALDRVLEQVAHRDSVCPIRCVGPDEHASQLPATIRALTLEERTAAVRQHTLKTARATRQAAEMECARRRHEEPLWVKLEELAGTLTASRAALTAAQAKWDAVTAEVRREVEAADGTERASRVAGEVQARKRTGEEKLAQLATETAAAEQQRDQERGKLTGLDQQIAAVEPLAGARQGGRWWAPTWWKALVKGNVVGKLAELQTDRQKVQAAASAADKQIQDLADARRAAEEKTAADVQARIQSEIDARQKKLTAVIDQHQAEVARGEALWADLCRQIDAEALRPAAAAPEAVHSAREQWQGRRDEDEARCTFAREWADFLESSSDVLAARLPGYANLVAATPTALAADPHFNDAGACGGQFDLLVLDEADQLAESEFLKAARRARQWVLAGEPPLHAYRSRTAPRQTGSGRGQYFHKLWEHLHCDPSLLPYAWFREGQRLGCRLRQLAPEQRQWLEIEPLADAPDVELRILALPRVRPVLAEVLFPGTMPLPMAKEFLFRELQEITVQTEGRCLRWRETPEAVVLHFGITAGCGGAPPAQENPGATDVGLDQGVREVLNGPNQDHTCQLEFHRAAGWDRAAVEQWLDQQLRLRDLGRTAWLEVPYRMTPPLAEIVNDLLGAGTYCISATRAETSEPAVEFVPVLGNPRGKGGSRNDHRGPRKPEAAPAGLPTTGAGLETDLASVRQGDRVPQELRNLPPGRGFVNLQEARAVVRKLEDLFRKPGVNGQGPLPTPSVGVLALYPAQAELIRQLAQQSPTLANVVAGSPDRATLVIGPPAAWRHREADTVVVSLTRSHHHRAVAYGEGPAALVLAWTRARRRLVLVGDPGNLARRCQWQGVLDHLEEAAACREGQLLGQLLRYIQGHGRRGRTFRMCEGTWA
jgi:hypothetical protein